jgi:NADP-dependent aldehyde dehydrogenase
MYNDATIDEINEIMQQAWKAFHGYRKLSLKQRADFMRAIAVELEKCGDELIQTAMRETNLPEARMRNERGRTIFQLNQYAAACEEGTWLEARIDTAIPDKNPPKPDIRKMLVPLGPVVVFGASNFPFAYSTAGGDTACALAAGCPVIVKAHPAHAETSETVAQAILRAARTCNMPEGIFPMCMELPLKWVRHWLNIHIRKRLALPALIWVANNYSIGVINAKNPFLFLLRWGVSTPFFYCLKN